MQNGIVLNELNPAEMAMSNTVVCRVQYDPVSTPVQNGIVLNELNPQEMVPVYMPEVVPHGQVGYDPVSTMRVDLQVISNFDYRPQDVPARRRMRSMSSPAQREAVVADVHSSAVKSDEVKEVKVCRDKPLQIRVHGVHTTGATVDEVSLVVMCPSTEKAAHTIPIGGADDEWTGQLHVDADGAFFTIPGSDSKKLLPSRPDARKQAKDRIPSCGTVKKLTLHLQIKLTILGSSKTLIAHEDLNIATDRHHRNKELGHYRGSEAVSRQQDSKRPRDEDPGVADQLQQSLETAQGLLKQAAQAECDSKRRRLNEIRMQLSHFKQEIVQLCSSSRQVVARDEPSCHSSPLSRLLDCD